ncbi:hypothetical protein FFLO_03401 [Filobasidium floriforme]|uniref:SUI1 domain-containing protein n=1 Tax=Filobasidium floriforme TaxID=5210 RepID=A0A8K0JL67_9TREE|nr:hypothetical protein FFLO_03401 [Filobasidium floriforme]
MLNLQSRDPFADADFGSPASSATAGAKANASRTSTPKIDDDLGGVAGGKIHIRIQQRNGRKTLTTVQGLDKAYDPKKILKAFKKEFACNGNVVSSEEAELGADAPEPAVPAGKTKPNFGQVIQLQGDQRNAVRDFLVSTGIVSEREAKEKIQM